MRKKGELRTFMASVRHASVRLVSKGQYSYSNSMVCWPATLTALRCLVYAFDPQASSGRYHAVVIGCRCWQSGQV